MDQLWLAFSGRD